MNDVWNQMSVRAECRLAASARYTHIVWTSSSKSSDGSGVSFSSRLTPPASSADFLIVRQCSNSSEGSRSSAGRPKRQPEAATKRLEEAVVTPDQPDAQVAAANDGSQGFACRVRQPRPSGQGASGPLPTEEESAESQGPEMGELAPVEGGESKSDPTSQRKERPRPPKAKRTQGKMLAEMLFNAQNDTYERREQAERVFVEETRADPVLSAYACKVLHCMQSEAASLRATTGEDEPLESRLRDMLEARVESLTEQCAHQQQFVECRPMISRTQQSWTAPGGSDIRAISSAPPRSRGAGSAPAVAQAPTRYPIYQQHVGTLPSVPSDGPNWRLAQEMGRHGPVCRESVSQPAPSSSFSVMPRRETGSGCSYPARESLTSRMEMSGQPLVTPHPQPGLLHGAVAPHRTQYRMRL
eukprot:gnl/TRDRNA2_/TRDRNA2_204164_c0_seq1.p1 gnl/TRDRNA2_/TRDRNA2_204164_c0~~gnl/TRDRNA2_/TRDRNA2_204164_c0_seq1.p1  ORF type:complete len:413 (-),score=42.44 gnl/TRDRNA2_/TRDRNA2_204164_c0_seq1:245-1483(-)